MKIPRYEIEPVIEDASRESKRTGKVQYVQAITFDLYTSLGFTEDPKLNIGRTHAICKPDGSIDRLWISKEEFSKKELEHFNNDVLARTGKLPD